MRVVRISSSVRSPDRRSSVAGPPDCEVQCEGRLHGRSWQAEDGTTRCSVEVIAEDLHALLRCRAHLGAGVSGPMISQACATGVACLEHAAAMVSLEPHGVVLIVTTDRTSNGPVLLHPAPSRPGGAPEVEHWVVDSFERDPSGGVSMIATAEAVAAEDGMGAASSMT